MTSAELDSQDAPFPRRREDIPADEHDQEFDVAIAWIRAQEKQLVEKLLEEGRREQPVENYETWRQDQRQRLGQGRQTWITVLSEAGWHFVGEGAHSMILLRPDLATELDLDPPNPLDMHMTACLNSGRSVWWRCASDNNHRWRTSVRNRHVLGTGCPRCGKRGVSRRENELFTALRATLPNLSSSAAVARARTTPGRRRARSWRVDMVHDEPKVVIEYDGAYWHANNEDKDRIKTADLAASGFFVVRVREHPLPAISPTDISCTADEPVEGIAQRVLACMREHRVWTDVAPAGEVQPEEGEVTTETADSELTLFSPTVHSEPKRQRRLLPRRLRSGRSEATPSALPFIVNKMLLEHHRCEVILDTSTASLLLYPSERSLLAVAADMRSSCDAMAAVTDIASAVLDASR
ncbi:zinc-ribbon domain-containing protein [Nocardia salmonicida]|uniref:zinc-ribbon domain-containing protein n=1 Tax=Nocardia salmonicida TaxID=53431 RepID=UPI003CF3EC36